MLTLYHDLWQKHMLCKITAELPQHAYLHKAHGATLAHVSTYICTHALALKHHLSSTCTRTKTYTHTPHHCPPLLPAPLCHPQLPLLPCLPLPHSSYGACLQECIHKKNILCTCVCICLHACACVYVRCFLCVRVCVCVSTLQPISGILDHCTTMLFSPCAFPLQDASSPRADYTPFQ